MKRLFATAALATLFGAWTPPADAATYEKIGEGVDPYPRDTWLERQMFAASGCQEQPSFGGYVWTVPSGTIEVRFISADTIVTDVQPVVEAYASCEDLKDAPPGSGQPGYRTTVTAPSFVLISHRGPALGVRYGLYRCISQEC